MLTRLQSEIDDESDVSDGQGDTLASDYVRGSHIRQESPLTFCSQCFFTENGDISAQYLNDIRIILCDFLRDVHVTYPNVPYDSDFAKSCCDVALRSNTLEPEMVDSPEFQLALHGAASIATTTYAHLENVSTRQWICLYTTWSVMLY